MGVLIMTNSIDISAVQQVAGMVISYPTTTGTGSDAPKKVVAPAEGTASGVNVSTDSHVTVSQVATSVENTEARLMDLLGPKIPPNTGVSFEVTSRGNVTIILRDMTTGKELRRIPPEDVVRMAQNAEDLRGLFVEQRR
jgi:uncharacterized FlaG/YvyC family protein